MYSTVHTDAVGTVQYPSSPPPSQVPTSTYFALQPAFRVSCGHFRVFCPGTPPRRCSPITKQICPRNILNMPTSQSRPWLYFCRASLSSPWRYQPPGFCVRSCTHSAQPPSTQRARLLFGWAQRSNTLSSSTPLSILQDPCIASPPSQALSPRIPPLAYQSWGVPCQLSVPSRPFNVV